MMISTINCLLAALGVTAITVGATSAAPLAESPRAGYVSAVLPGGRLLVAGGAPRKEAPTAEIYDARKRAWRRTATAMIQGFRQDASGVTLKDGSFLVTGGRDEHDVALGSTERFVIADESWTAGPALLTPRFGHASVLLADGRVLVVGGSTTRTGRGLAEAEIYDPATGAFRAAAPLRFARPADPIALRLPSGDVLVLGEIADDSAGGLIAHLAGWVGEIYDPARDAWRDAGRFKLLPRGGVVRAALLQPGGDVIVVGEMGPPSVRNADRQHQFSARYDPKSASFDALQTDLPFEGVVTTLGLVHGRTVAVSARHAYALASAPRADWSELSPPWSAGTILLKPVIAQLSPSEFVVTNGNEIFALRVR